MHRKGDNMAVVIKVKQVSYGLVELRDNGSGNPRYVIYVNGKSREYSNDLAYMINLFDSKYY